MVRLDTLELTHFRALYQALSNHYKASVLLDSCGYHTLPLSQGFYMMGFEPTRIVQLLDDTLWVNKKAIATIGDKQRLWALLENLFLEDLADRFSESNLANAKAYQLPFVDGWIGTLGYELNHWLEPRVKQRQQQDGFGSLLFYRFAHRILWHPTTGQFHIFSDSPSFKQLATTTLTQLIQTPSQTPKFTRLSTSVSRLEQSFSQESFEQQVKTIQSYIAQGEIYQANLSIRFALSAVPSDLLYPLYLTLVQQNPSAFSGFLNTPEATLICNSPERLVKYDPQTNVIETRPIAGTRGRRNDESEQARIDLQLLNDPKERAEHLMLLDLERNDIGRVAQPGSVYVPESFALEHYAHVTHIISQVEGERDPQKSRWDILEAMFPGGTITGCPKVRCMEILRETEPVARGLYTGSLGYLDFRGHMDFNILIRSLFHQQANDTLYFHAGAGIVADSVAANEYRECLRKVEAIQGVLFHEPSLTHR